MQSILLTHAHVDHVTGVARAKQALQVPVYLHRDDQFLYDAAPQQAAFFGLHCDALPAIDRYYDLAETLSFGEYEVAVHHTPGHCPGGVCLAIGRKGSTKDDLFVGDTLFAGSIGRTDLPGGDHPDADSIDHAGAVCLRRCGAGVLRARSADDDRPGAPDESVPDGPAEAGHYVLRDTINSSRPTDSLSPSRSSAVFTRLPLTNVPFVLPRSFT